MTASSQKSDPLKGVVRAPGDKSISHRSLILGAMANGTTTISGLLEGADIMSTADAMRAFGAEVTKTSNGNWQVLGQNIWKKPIRNVDCGNAGTGVRLIMGAASGYDMMAQFTGDESLSSRPMARVTRPLEKMGVKLTCSNGDRLPIELHSNGQLSALEYESPKASAQVKSCILLAGLNSVGETVVIEKPTRDHTENMLRAFGCPVRTERLSDGRNRVSVNRSQSDIKQGLVATHVDVPGDPSSAAFPIVAALITPGSDITVENVMMNPTRTGLLETLVEMGANLTTSNERVSGGELIADIRVQYSQLYGITVPSERAASMIDEYPILAVAASQAKGVTHMPGIHELRVKESDRIAATEALLSINGVKVSSTQDSLTVTESSVKGGGTVTTHHDHRIAMSALILGLVAKKAVSVDDASMIATSFPSFFDLMSSLGAKISS